MQRTSSPQLERRSPRDAETIGSHLSTHGFETFATISNPQLTQPRNFDIGFDSFLKIRVDNDEETEGASEREIDNPILRRLSLGKRPYALRERIRERESLRFYHRWPVVALREYQYRSD
jgi:hypothetical protein